MTDITLDRESSIRRTPGTRRKRLPLAERMQQSPGVFLLIFTVVYLIANISSASQRLLTFDELINSYLGDLPHIDQIWGLVGRGIELNPPLTFWLTWLIHHTLGRGEVLSRLPAIFGFWLMCICLYWIVRRRSDALFGFVGFLLPLFTYTSTDATVARGYGLMLGMSALAILGWQVATDGVRRPLALAGIVLGIAVAVSSHYYAVYVVGAIGLGELVRTWDRKRLDPPIWCSLALGLSPLVVYAPLLRSAAAGATKNFWMTPKIVFLYQAYADLLGPISMVFFLLLALSIWPRDRAGKEDDEHTWMAPTIRRHEWATLMALLAMPLLIYVAGVLAGVPFFSRYVMQVVIGFTVVIALFAYRIGGQHPHFRRTMAVLLVWLCFAPWSLWSVCKLVVGPRPHEYLASHPKLPFDLSLPIVIETESDFIEYYHYAPPELKERLFTLTDQAAAVRFRGSDTGQRSIELAQTFREMHAVDYHKFVSAHPQFLIVRRLADGWTVAALLAEGAKVEMLRLEKDLGYNVLETAIYRIEMPSHH